RLLNPPHLPLFLSLLPPTPPPPLFPYTTLFRSPPWWVRRAGAAGRRAGLRPQAHTRRSTPGLGSTARGAPAGDPTRRRVDDVPRSEEHTSELQSLTNLVCRLLLEKKKSPSNISS